MLCLYSGDPQVYSGDDNPGTKVGNKSKYFLIETNDENSGKNLYLKYLI